MSSLEGGSFESGFAAGAIASLVSSGIGALGETGAIGTNTNGSTFAKQNKFGQSNWFKATMIASAGLSGGLSSSIAGGNFWAGARQGVIVAGLNHLGHMRFDKSGESTAENKDDIDQEDPPAKKKPTLDEIARSEGYTNHQFKLLYEFNKLVLDARAFFVGGGTNALAVVPIKMIRIGKFTTPIKLFHSSIKPKILTATFENIGKYQHIVGTNPDILIKGSKIFLTGAKSSPFYGKTFATGLEAINFF